MRNERLTEAEYSRAAMLNENLRSEQEVELRLCFHLHASGIEYSRQPPAGSGVMDVIYENPNKTKVGVEIKYDPSRDTLYKAIGQAVMYKEALRPSEMVVCCYFLRYDRAKMEEWQTAARSAGIYIASFENVILNIYKRIVRDREHRDAENCETR